MRSTLFLKLIATISNLPMSSTNCVAEQRVGYFSTFWVCSYNVPWAIASVLLR